MYAGEVVEAGRAEDVLERPRHPYTMGLTNAFPDLERAATRWRRSPVRRLICAFRRRDAGSPRAAPSHCRSAMPSPPLEQGADGHASACWRSAEADDLSVSARNPAIWTGLSTSAA